MFARFRAMAVNATHVAGHPDDNLLATREPAPVGEAFEHADGSIAIYLDALPVSGRLLLVPVDDLRARPVRRGAVAGEHALIGPIDGCECRPCRQKRLVQCPPGERLL